MLTSPDVIGVTFCGHEMCFANVFLCISGLKKVIVSIYFSWNDDENCDDGLPGPSECWSSAVPSTIAPMIKAEERINAAAISARSHTRNHTGIVLGGMVYDMLKDLYFRV
jgi:hypothetical protein